ncbi:hypothetical protein U6L75_08700 [Cutibacterium acnes]|nr:hypothetical protein AK827_08825 [Cutibacterium acnes]KPG67498.1 hypothetical protein AK828_02125 [Cutibacterium acnes]PZA03169.1 hypothetical protein Asn12ST33_04345 [Cutibacterium acnes]WGH37827.1 hypothetical protein OYC58_002365 [Cutibacterium acnes]WGH38686.1 hypothetical protein OYC57_002347 [Cutibacterium acnes]
MQHGDSIRSRSLPRHTDGSNRAATPHRRYQLPSTGGDPAIGLTGIAGIVGLGTVITTTVTATHKSRR